MNGNGRAGMIPTLSTLISVGGPVWRRAITVVEFAVTPVRLTLVAHIGPSTW